MSDQANALVLLTGPESGAKARASSILQRNTKLYGPAHALDTEKTSSCWNSEGNNAAKTWFAIDFGRTVSIQKLAVQFQAGFCAETCTIHIQSDKKAAWTELLTDYEFEDTYELQTVNFEKGCECTGIQLLLEDFTDFYGRVTIYRLEVWGKPVES